MPAAIEEPTGLKLALEGRVVTMDAQRRVLERGVVYVDSGVIAQVLPEAATPPAGFEAVPLTRSRGTLYPGLIELHNHLPYNVLPLWQVPRRFQRREQWGSHPEKQALVSAPMRVLGETAGYIEAVVRYVECKCLLAGVTASQGITLFSAPGSQRYYRGVVRNVEQTDDPALPNARAKISDVDSASVASFFNTLRSASCLLLHLSEGVDDRAREHFRRLALPQGDWAISPALSGIHALGLTAEDLAVHGGHGGAIVWSPLSNLLLYGQTLDLVAVKANGIRIALGSDWSPTGSKNLLAELKIARTVNAHQGTVYSDTELVAMATSNAAAMLGWSGALGSLEAGKYADLLVLAGRQGDPYAELLEASETRVSLVLIHGVARCGWPSLMAGLDLGGEPWRVGRARRVLQLQQQSADPLVAGLSLQQASDRLRDGLSRLHELAAAREHRITAAARGLAVAPEPPWKLLLDNDEPPEIAASLGRAGLGISVATPHGVVRSEAMTASQITAATAAVSIELDPLTVADDPAYGRRLQEAANLPDFVKAELQQAF